MPPASVDIRIPVCINSCIRTQIFFKKFALKQFIKLIVGFEYLKICIMFLVKQCTIERVPGNVEICMLCDV